jgi:ATP phosphoribosyltransferase
MLKVAVPNKGILSETALLMLKEAGYAIRRDPKDLHVIDSKHDIEFFYLRPRDIATYVGEGSLDAGFTGLDLLRDSRSKAVAVADLRFGESTFRFAGPVGKFKSLDELQGLRQELSDLRAEQMTASAAIASGTGKTARILERVTPDGDAIAVRTAA